MYSKRIDLAFTTMLEAHGLRRGKSGKGFQATHVTSVAMIVADYGFDEDTIIAALLHDTLEDTDLAPSVIESLFGKTVLATVQDVSEPSKSSEWRQRKEVYIEQLRTTPRNAAWAVASADKIHNLSRMSEGLRNDGETFFNFFSASLKEMVWYQKQVLDTLSDSWKHIILEEHARQANVFFELVDDISEKKRLYK